MSGETLRPYPFLADEKLRLLWEAIQMGNRQKVIEKLSAIADSIASASGPTQKVSTSSTSTTDVNTGVKIKNGAYFVSVTFAGIGADGTKYGNRIETIIGKIGDTVSVGDNDNLSSPSIQNGASFAVTNSGDIIIAQITPASSQNTTWRIVTRIEGLSE